jgi:2-succinyl-6-hydroxy-2,4-cyclohexadiene-1-carboxylate synthase
VRDDQALRFHFDVHAGEGPPLLLVHGMLSGRAQWAPNLAALARVSRPVVVELWGHGRSPAPEAPELYRPSILVRLFEEIRRELGAERWLVCGASLGAALTLRYALDHPDRVIAQVFTNSVSALADEAWTKATRDTAETMSAAIAEGGREGLEKLPIHPLRAKRLAPEVKAAILADAALVDPGAVARIWRHLLPESSVRDRVGRNCVPTLLVCGEREKRFAPHREHAERTMPELEVVRLDAGHAVNLEAPADFDAAVRGFLNRREYRGSI